MFAVKLSPFSLTEITDEFCSRMKYVLSNKVIQARLISLKRLSLLDSKKIVEVHMDESKLNSKILSNLNLKHLHYHNTLLKIIWVKIISL